MQKKLNVQLIAHTPDPERIIAGSAKLCYSAKDVESTMEQSSKEQNEKFVQMLIDMGHESPLEHITFTFGIEGVSRSLTHQLVRHRVGASYSQKSQRYVDENGFDYIIPPEIEERGDAKELFLIAMERSEAIYDDIVRILFQDYIRMYMDEGKTEKEARKIAKKKAIEDARFVLPNACETKIIVTMNARALLNFFTMRGCNRAQWEIRELAIEMLRQVKQIAPTVFKNAGASCVRGACPEVKMSCGKMAEVRERFNTL